MDTAQICPESGSKSGEKHSFLNTDLCMHDGPINVLGELQESRPTRGSLNELVSQSNVDTKVTTTQIVDGIINAINVIRYTFKKRPDTASISEYLERNNGIENNRVLHVIQSLTDRSRVHLNRVKGKDSYFIGIAPLPDDEQYLTEIEGQNNDSCLDGIRTPPERDPSLTSQLCLQDSF